MYLSVRKIFVNLESMVTRSAWQASGENYIPIVSKLNYNTKHVQHVRLCYVYNEIKY